MAAYCLYKYCQKTVATYVCGTVVRVQATTATGEVEVPSTYS